MIFCLWVLRLLYSCRSFSICLTPLTAWETVNGVALQPTGRYTIMDSTETIANQNAWLLMRPRFSLGIEHTFKPLQANLRIGVSSFGARIMPFRGGVHGPVTFDGLWLAR
jgi:hypothetical protein